MENKNLNEVKDLNENEFEKVSGGMNKNTKSVKLRDDEVIRDGGWSGLPRYKCKCISCGEQFSDIMMCGLCPKCRRN